MASDLSTPETTSPSTTRADDYFYSIIDGTQVAMGVLDLSGRLEFVNRRAVELLGLQGSDQAIGRPATDFWPVAMRLELERAIAVAANGAVARFRGLGPTPDGAPMWWEATLAPVFGDRGEVVRLAAHMHDVTGEMEAASFLDAIVEHVPTMLFVKDVQDGRFVLINRVAEDIFGRSREEMLGRTDHDFFPKEQADFFRERDTEVVRSGQAHLIEEDPVTTAGGLRWLRTRKAATYGPDGPRHLVVVAEDITERKQAEEDLKAALLGAEAASRAKSVFLTNMSHELRTPLNGVLGMAELLGEAPLSTAHRRMLDMIQESGRALERIVSDVLEVAEIEAGRVEVRSEDFDLGDAVRDLADLFEAQARDKGLVLRLSTADAIGQRVRGDAGRLKQTLGKLLENAVKFTERGEIALTVEPSHGGIWRFLVADTGIGFDPADKAGLFGRFRQADGSARRRFGGVGLGLSVANELANRMGGAIDCDSTPGRGSIFVLTLPLGAAPEPASGRSASVALAG